MFIHISKDLYKYRYKFGLSDLPWICIMTHTSVGDLYLMTIASFVMLRRDGLFNEFTAASSPEL